MLRDGLPTGSPCDTAVMIKDDDDASIVQSL